ncbi:MAG TPA: MFS transporter, partial [Acinetobacter radioresistens]|nr:MFS transporter [Acinetobacter radioresistens]
MQTIHGNGSHSKKSSHRLAGISSMVGTTIEWYDFFIYGAAAALIFNKLFFPNLDPLTGVLAAFATYAVGFIGRPLGGIVFGHFGDKVGRKSMLLVTL